MILSFLLQTLPSPEQAAAVEKNFLGYAILILILAVASLFLLLLKEAKDHRKTLSSTYADNLQIQLKQVEAMNTLSESMTELSKVVQNLNLGTTHGISDLKEYIADRSEKIIDKIDK